MIIIGLTGPTGAGKTTVLSALEGLDCAVVDCDGVYHRLLETSPELLGELTERFGRSILDSRNKLDRKALGRVVFGDPAALADLNRLTHRHILAELERLTGEAKGSGKRGVVYDAIALWESGLGSRCQVTVAVLAPPEARVARIMARDGIPEEYARARVAAQKDDSYYVNHCDQVIVNDGSLGREEFSQQVRALFTEILCKSTEEVLPMENQPKTLGDARRDALLYQPKNGYDRLESADEIAMRSYCEEYKKFLDDGKTERECVAAAVALAQANGFSPLTRGGVLRPGDKVYRVNRGKSIMLAVIGSEPLSKGANIAAAHIDSPRLDLKPTPLYEDSEMAFLKTHYYGGIRKYQWVAIPLELHGVVALKDGGLVNVNIGGGAGDPVFTVDDLLPHLAADQSKKPLGEAIPAENLNILVGSRPFAGDEGSDRVKLAVMDILHEKYGIVEEDFLSAELEIVPAFRASDLGLDRSMIGAYGHDDRVCAYACLAGLFDLNEVPAKTAVCMLADKEEIGSEGVTGMRSAAFDTFMSDLCDSQQIPLKRCFENSFCLSADVTAAYDPNFAEVYDKRNSARINYGVGLCKYTGARGKSGASDAGAETLGYIRKVLDAAGVVWQLAEMGKVDQGGGGTVAVYMAQRDIDVLDAGVPVLSMHAPYETVAKLDCYMTYKAAKAVYLAH